MQFIESEMVKIPIYDREIPIWHLRMIEKSIKKRGGDVMKLRVNKI